MAPSDPALTPRSLLSRLRHLAVPVLVLAVCALILLGLQKLTGSLDYRVVVRQLLHLPPRALAAALGATLLSYLALVARDAVALRRIGARVPWAALWIGSVTGSALGNVAGFGALTGGAVRYRVFAPSGIGAEAVTRMTLLTSATFGLGLMVLGGFGAVSAAPALGRLLGLAPDGIRAGGLVALALVAAGMLAAALAARRRGGLLRIGRVSLEWPGFAFLLAQIALVAVDVAGAGLCLWALLPAVKLGLPAFFALFAVAMLLGVAVHTPGGIGVFEAAMLFSLDSSVHPSAALAALVAYRAIYFGLPLLLSAGLLGSLEARAATRWARGRGLPSDALRRLAPLFVGVFTFAVGVMLVLSGATPAFRHRLAILQDTVPLWVLESSNLLGSILGAWLLFVARGLFRRLDAAWWLALGIAAASLVLSLAKGLAFGEVTVLSVLLLLLLATRHNFVRPASLFHTRFTPGWLASVAAVLVVAFWVFFFAFRHVPYSHDLWWQFAFDEKAPRALRATVGATLFASAIALWQMLRLAPGKVSPPSDADLLDAARVVRAQERSDAVLAMMGDKSFLFSPSRNAFLMYAKRGRSWLALYDPVGPRGEWKGLIERFVGLAHAHGGRVAFYQVRPENLPLYLDAGLTLLKLGEEACIRLTDFRLEGGARAHLRYALKRGERDGLSAEVIGPDAQAGIAAELEAISVGWLRGRRGREKGFSVASFDPAALMSQSVMLVRQNGRAVAFAAFMTTDLHTEATVGAMRHLPEASPYAMEYLFTRLTMHLKDAGFGTLSLGMAPLSGVAPAPLARLWHWLAHLLWRYGGRVYNFQGLRSFKGKFQPAWEPRYLAASGRIGPFLALADVAVLAGGRGA